MRKNIPLVLAHIFFILVSGCRPGLRSNISTELIEKIESCAGDPMHSYALYIPKTESKCSSLPLVIILDPQGEGIEAIEHFKMGADQHGCILAASLLVKNNFPDYIIAINSLIEDVQNKYPAGNRIYLAGFSGGGRMALNFAQYFTVSGLVVCGGLTPARQFEEIPCRVIGIAGMADFNFIETAQYIFNYSEAPSNLIVDFTPNSHEWADNTAIANALGYLIYSSEGKGACFGKSEFNKFCISRRNEIDSLRREKKYLQAGIVARKMAGHENFIEKEDFISLRNSIEFSAPYITEQKMLKESIRLELAVRNDYSKALQQMDAQWWKNEISSIEDKIVTDKDVYRRFAYLRIKGFLGILCYSLTNNSIIKNNIEDTERLLEIYRMVEPRNPDMFYFSALLALQKGNSDLAATCLIDARKAGFSDVQRLMRDFPANVTKTIGMN